MDGKTPAGHRRYAGNDSPHKEWPPPDSALAELTVRALSHAPDTVLLTDSNTTILQTNQTALKQIGCLLEDIV